MVRSRMKEGIGMKKQGIIQLPKLPATLTAFNEMEEDEDFFIYSCILSHMDFPYFNTDRITFEQVKFQNVKFSDEELPQLNLTDAIIENCDFSNADLSNAVIHRTIFKDCKLTGVNFSDATMRNVVFENCHANYISFGFADLKLVKFLETILKQGDFLEMKQSQLQFQQCDIDAANFTGTDMNGIDLTTCQFDELIVSPEFLRGCSITGAQAAAFVSAFGMVIKG